MAADELSAYERQRLATIASNEAWMAEHLGSFGKVVPPKEPSVKRTKQPKPETRSGPSRKSRRISGEDAPDVADAPEELQEDGLRDPNDVSRMSQTEKRTWCDQIRDTVLEKSCFEDLTEEQQQNLREANDKWLGSFTWFTAQFDMQGERPLSRNNLKSVLRQLMLLVSEVWCRALTRTRNSLPQTSRSVACSSSCCCPSRASYCRGCTARR